MIDALLTVNTPTSTIYEALGKTGDVGPSIMSLGAHRWMAGFAVTVECFPGDARGVFEALDTCKPGDVLVIDIGGGPLVTAWGGTSTKAAMRRGVAGVITNGSIRDRAEIVDLGFPVFASGTSVRGTVKSRSGIINGIVSIGHRAIAPGDLVVGDGDGLVIVPKDRLSELHQIAGEQRAREEAIDRRVVSGESPMDIFGLRATA